ncbi:translation initiation factor eIF-2B subunit gamma-like [Acanthaster planci]|uniref:Translation initiation factor eIF2B subunit gamma n=1 Tax=Acanthaster planci TaxID=133434 RepID=A0A8B7ZXW8_ACAPL|nr:translation initiation factor eIF-2B subunit gamma-like [Acanthaster planci]XP_022110389.1 translation initiation factor eIF-2B subunit gamma-like [Acanthaster planci]
MEFQAVIMAGGRGSRMPDLTASVPKALLPVGNRPLVWYPVNMLDKAGFESVIIVTFDSVKRDLVQALQSSAGELLIRLDVVTIPSDEDWGTAESLRFIRDKIKTDVLVISCDLITDIELHLLADVHRTYDASMTMLMHTTLDQSNEGGVSVPGTKSKRKTEQRDIVGLDDKGSRILLLAAEADVEEALSVKKSVLKRYPFIQVKTRLMDAHMYILKKWVLDFLGDNKIGRTYSTIKGELIPYLVRKQFSRPKTGQLGPQLDSMESVALQQDKDLSSYGGLDDLTKKARAMSSWNEHSGDMSDYYQHGDTLRCHTYIMDSGFCIRANTLAAYCEANRQIPQQRQLVGEDPLIHPTATIKTKSQVGQDSMLGEGTTIGEKVSVKRSIIGKHCIVGDKVKIINSVVMDHVNISEGCTIQGSIVCGNTHVSEAVEMKDCLIGSSQNIPPKAKYSNEVIGNADRMMEI